MISEQANSSTRRAQSEAGCSLRGHEPAHWPSPCAPATAWDAHGQLPSALGSRHKCEKKGQEIREKKAKREEEIQMGRSSISRVEVATRLGLTKVPEKLECKEMPENTEERLQSRTI